MTGKKLHTTRNYAKENYRYSYFLCKRVATLLDLWQPTPPDDKPMKAQDTESNPFCRKLKLLRGAIAVEELANQTGVAASSIYKMEANPKVRWHTVEQAYGHLFQGPEDHCTTLILWALQQTEKKFALYEAAETAKSLLREEREGVNEHAEAIAAILRRLTPVTAKEMLEFCRKYATDAPTRQLVKAWLSATKA